MFDSTLISVADQLVACCRQREEERALEELYAPDCVSVEAAKSMAFESREHVGVEAIRAKHAWWNERMDIHESTVEGPFLHGEDRFGVIFNVDVTDRESGNRLVARELAIYTVKNGRIVREEFFNTP